MIMNVWSILENLNCRILWDAKFKGLGAVLISLIIVSIDAHVLKIQWEGPSGFCHFWGGRVHRGCENFWVRVHLFGVLLHFY
jgi:hypothetical protein